ncbi:MAG: hypothetical protein IPL00_06025 [Gammaproteobacteria bacterium]|nr:hypothetical protein [Gammaproteobacteria bacterium]
MNAQEVLYASVELSLAAYAALVLDSTNKQKAVLQTAGMTETRLSRNFRPLYKNSRGKAGYDSRGSSGFSATVLKRRLTES